MRKEEVDAIAAQLITMSEGNPGAITVLSRVVTNVPKEQVKEIIAEIEKQQLTGSKLWVAYKDHCNSNVDQLVTGIVNQSPGIKEALIRGGFTDFEWTP